jgi:hypothetical protein
VVAVPPARVKDDLDGEEGPRLDSHGANRSWR